jgi:hypothetical protein
MSGKIQIPQNAFSLTTQSRATYKFGPADANGFRTVDRLPTNTLSFTRGKIVGSGRAHFLGVSVEDSDAIVVGANLLILPEGKPMSQIWATSAVVSVH